MKYVKMLGLAAIAAAALMAFVGASSASATVLCKDNTSPCTADMVKGEKVNANLKAGTKAVLLAGFANIECSKSTVVGEVEEPGGAGKTVSGPITTLTFGECGAATVTVVKNGRLTVSQIGETVNGAITTSGVEVSVAVGATTCTYGGEIKSGITLNGGEAPNVVAKEAPVPRLAGGILCANPAKWNAEYDITSPKPLRVRAE